MAYQVAQAYDENKNLVPLYVLTDGEVPEVSPGFDALVNDEGISITATSTNPTGGLIELGKCFVPNDGQVTVYNMSDFLIKVSYTVDVTNGASYGFSNLQVQPHDTSIGNISIKNYTGAGRVIIERVRT